MFHKDRFSTAKLSTVIFFGLKEAVSCFAGRQKDEYLHKQRKVILFCGSNAHDGNKNSRSSSYKRIILKIWKPHFFDLANRY